MGSFRVIDGRTEEGRAEFEVKRQVDDLVRSVLFATFNGIGAAVSDKRPGSFIERRRHLYPNLGDMRSSHFQASQEALGGKPKR